jgi:hypothetical protein
MKAMSSMRSLSTARNRYFRKPRPGRVVVEVGEGDFRLDHPELGQVARGVAVLGAEGRAEGVDLAQREAVALDVELAGHGQEGFLAEEVAAEVDVALAVARQVGHVQRGHAEHLSGAFGVEVVMIGVEIQ